MARGFGENLLCVHGTTEVVVRSGLNACENTEDRDLRSTEDSAMQSVNTLGHVVQTPDKHQLTSVELAGPYFIFIIANEVL
jgi:hypothetical protein